jgi:hypothetical protein
VALASLYSGLSGVTELAGGEETCHFNRCLHTDLKSPQGQDVQDDFGGREVMICRTCPLSQIRKFRKSGSGGRVAI